MFGRYRGRLALTALTLVGGAYLPATLQAEEESSHPVSTSMTTSASRINPMSQEEISKVSESFGHLIGRNLENPGFKFDLSSIIKGMNDAVAGKASPMTEQEYEEAIARIQEQAINQLSETNLKQANAFLATNVANSNVIELESGKLQYEVLQKGSSDLTVVEHSTPLIHYTGKYLDGTVFGSSVETGTPIKLALDHTIPGFNRGLIGMQQGEKRRLFVHPDMAYGTSGHLPPNSLLIFDVEIVSTQVKESSENSHESSPVASSEAKPTAS